MSETRIQVIVTEQFGGLFADLASKAWLRSRDMRVIALICAPNARRRRPRIQIGRLALFAFPQGPAPWRAIDAVRQFRKKHLSVRALARWTASQMLQIARGPFDIRRFFDCRVQNLPL